MNLKILNVLAMALLGVAVHEREDPRRYRLLLAAAALVDFVILATLMGQRGAAATAGGLEMTPVRVTHIAASAIFPLLYPFLLIGSPRRRDGGGDYHPAYLGAFFLLRFVSFWTSYSMRA